MKKTKLSVDMLYSKILVLFATIFYLAGFIVILVCLHDNIIYTICAFIIFLPGTFMCFYVFLLTLQVAILDNKGIVFKNIFKVVGEVRWAEIKDVKVMNLKTLESKGVPVLVQWIVIFTDMEQTSIPNISQMIGGANQSNKSPYKIKASKKNVRIMNEYLHKYRSDLWVHLDKDKPNTKHH